MSYGYSAKLIKLNKQASRKLLGVRLGRLCIKCDIPVAQVARKLGVSRQTVYNWFVGASSPRAELIPAVEKFIASHS
jgi:DNA-binding XRE family transcriptional regulator